MKNRIFSVVMGVCLVSIGLYFFLKMGPESQSPVVSTIKNEQKTTLRTLLNQPSRLELKKTQPDLGESLSKVCLEEWEAISEVDLTDIDVEKIKSLVNHSQCKNYPKELSLVSTTFLKNCSEVVEVPDGKNETLKKCIGDLYLYRASLADWFSRDEDISKIADKKLLFEKLYSMMGRGEFDPGKLDALSSRFLELDPSNTEIQRVSIVANLLGLMSEADDPTKDRKAVTQDPKWEKLSALYDIYLDTSRKQNLEKNYNDSKVLELGLFINSKSLEDLVALEKESKIFIDEHPDKKDIGYYYLAGAHWNSGRKEEALEALEEAAKLNPGEKRYQTSLGKMKDNKQSKQKGVFEFSFDANMEMNLD